MGSNLRGKSGGNAAPSSVCEDEDKIPDSVIRVNRNSAHGTGHPATFPVPLPTVAMRCWPGSVYDPFLGSGTTLIAADSGRFRQGTARLWLLTAQAVNDIDNIHPAAGTQDAVNARHLASHIHAVALCQAACCDQGLPFELLR